MQALSVRQPWAFALIAGVKDIENRTWASSHRGLLIIHAAKKRDAKMEAAVIAKVAQVSHVSRDRVEDFYNELVQWNGFIGAVHVHGMLRKSESPWFEGPVGWGVHRAEMFTPVAASGRQGVFQLTAAEVRAVRAALDAPRPTLLRGLSAQPTRTHRS